MTTTTTTMDPNTTQFILIATLFTAGFAAVTSAASAAKNHRKMGSTTVMCYYTALYTATYIHVFVCAHQLLCGLTHPRPYRGYEPQFDPDAEHHHRCYLAKRQVAIALVTAAFVRFALAFRMAPVLVADGLVALSVTLAGHERDAVVATAATGLLSHAIMTTIAHCEVQTSTGRGDDDDDDKPDEPHEDVDDDDDHDDNNVV